MRYCQNCNQDLVDPSHQFCGVCGDARPQGGWAQDPYVGAVIAGGQYKVRRRLGSGGFGLVYEVETVLGGLVRAMKVLGENWGTDAAVRQRFVNEAVFLDKLDHPHIARVHAVGTLGAGGQPYILMELIPGRDLTALVQPAETGVPAAPLEPLRAVRLGRQIAAALRAAHAMRLLHRDLKPDNVLIVRDGDEESAKVIDFGIARILGAENGPTGTLGTPLYMAPEQYEPGTPSDERLDLWQLGAVLHFALTGHPPYRPPEGKWGPLTLYFQQRARAGQPGPAPSEVAPALAAWPGLDELVSSLLATDRDARPASAAEVESMLVDIEERRGGTVSGTQPRFLESLCASPSESHWRSLCQCLRTWPDPVARGTLIRRTAERLDRWDAALRVAPAGWWHADAQQDLWALVRAARLSHAGLDNDAIDGVVGRLPAGLVELDLSHNRLGDRAARTLAQTASLGNLEHLDLGANRLAIAGVEALASSPYLTHVRHLSLAGNAVRLGGVQALLASPFLTRLESLDLSACRLGPDAAAALATSHALRRLRALRLDHNAIGAAGIEALAQSPNLAQLDTLHLRNTRLGRQGVQALAHSRGLRGLRTLSLASNHLDAGAMAVLGTAACIHGVSNLDLSGNPLGPGGAVALALAPQLFGVSHLDLSDCALGDAGLTALVVAQWAARLTDWNLSGNHIGPGGAAAAFAAPQAWRLARLELAHNPLGPAGAIAVTASETLPALEHLNLDSCELDGTAAHRVLSGDAGRLASLNLAGNALGAYGATQLLGAPNIARLEALSLAENGLGIEGARAVATCARLTHLHALDMGRNDLGDDGAEQLAQARLPGLRTLGLAVNGLGPEGIAHIVGAAGLRNLETLDASHNRIGDTGARALAGAPHLSHLTTLTLQDCEIEPDGAHALRGSAHLVDATRLDLRFNPAERVLVQSLEDVGADRVRLIQESFQAVSDQGDALVARFYEELFARHPSVRPLFANVNPRRQQQHLLAALGMVVRKLSEPQDLSATLISLGRRHVGYNVQPEQYLAITTTLVDVIAEFAGDLWSPQLQDAWREGLYAVSALMLRGHAH